MGGQKRDARIKKRDMKRLTALFLSAFLIALPRHGSTEEVRPIFGAHYGAPLGFAGTAGVLIGDGCGDCNDAAHFAGLVRVSGGQGGLKGSLGFGAGGFGPSPFSAIGISLNATVTRTWGSPVGVEGSGTYLGAELDLAMFARASVGVARRISGQTSEDTLVTWTIGFGF